MQANSKLFDQDPTTYNNIGVEQTNLGISQRDKPLLESAIQHFQKAIAITELNPGKNYPIAEENLKWARKELSKLS